VEERAQGDDACAGDAEVCFDDAVEAGGGFVPCWVERFGGGVEGLEAKGGDNACAVWGRGFSSYIKRAGTDR